MDKDDVSVAKKATGLWVIRVLVLLFQLAPILRYCESLAYALQSRRAEKARDGHGQRRFYELMLKEDSDVALLRVFECFLEAAPQQVLQISILLANTGRRLGDLQVLTQAASILSSLFSMGWSMASYHRSIRFVQKDKDNISWPGTVMQFLWHFPITVSRILSISAIASVCPYWMAGAVVVHWLVMSAWISVLDRTQFCVSTRGDPWRQKVGETLFSFVLGLVYVFTYLTPGEGRTRNRFLVFYSLCFAENMAAVGTWAALAGDETRGRWFFLPLTCGAAVSYVLGVCFMLVYYRFFHPRRVSPPHSPAAATRTS
ncbi:XK-related protein 7-like isoform X2 [Bacillus rossius redtenbacheri]